MHRKTLSKRPDSLNTQTPTWPFSRDSPSDTPRDQHDLLCRLETLVLETEPHLTAGKHRETTDTLASLMTRLDTPSRVFLQHQLVKNLAHRSLTTLKNRGDLSLPDPRPALFETASRVFTSGSEAEPLWAEAFWETAKLCDLFDSAVALCADERWLTLLTHPKARRELHTRLKAVTHNPADAPALQSEDFHDWDLGLRRTTTFKPTVLEHRQVGCLIARVRRLEEQDVGKGRMLAPLSNGKVLKRPLMTSLILGTPVTHLHNAIRWADPKDVETTNGLDRILHSHHGRVAWGRILKSLSSRDKLEAISWLYTSPFSVQTDVLEGPPSPVRTTLLFLLNGF